MKDSNQNIHQSAIGYQGHSLRAILIIEESTEVPFQRKEMKRVGRRRE